MVGDGDRRGHSFKLFKKKYRLNVGTFKFASRVCDEWNRLGDGIVSAVETCTGCRGPARPGPARCPQHPARPVDMISYFYRARPPAKI